TIRLQYDLDDQSGPVLAAPTEIQQVLVNLCTNAAHAMRHTGGLLEVRLETLALPAMVAVTHPSLAPGSYLRLTVRDTGHGMTPEVMERIFEPFFTTKDTGEGTGLGLAVVHGIVSAHQGAITVNSAPGEGTTFAVYFPQSDRAAPAPDVTAAPV